MEKAYLVYNRSEARASDDNAGYWSNTDGWTTIDAATVFFEEDRARSNVLPPGAAMVEAPALRWNEDRRATWVGQIEAGCVVYVHDPNAASLLPSAQLPGLDDHYVFEGRRADHLVLRKFGGSSVEVPSTMVFPSPLDTGLTLLRESLQDRPLSIALRYDRGAPWLHITVAGSLDPGTLIGPAFVTHASDDRTELRIDHPAVEWPLPVRAGDLVTWADPDNGETSCLAVALRSEDDCDDTCRIRRTHAGTEFEVPLHELAAAPQTRALHGLRNALVQELPMAAFEILQFKLDTSPEGLDDLSVARVQIGGLLDLNPVHRSRVEELVRASWAVEVDTRGVLHAKADIGGTITYDIEAFDEAWGVIRPERGGFFEREDVEDVCTDTLWTVIEFDSKALWLFPGDCAGNVLGFLRTRRPYVTTNEQALDTGRMGAKVPAQQPSRANPGVVWP